MVEKKALSPKIVGEIETKKNGERAKRAVGESREMEDERPFRGEGEISFSRWSELQDEGD